MAATLRKAGVSRFVIADAKEFVWRKKLGGYGVREIAAMVSEHLGRPVSRMTVQRWVIEGERACIARTASAQDTHRAVELAKLDEMERRVQEVMDATHYALAAGVVVRGLPASDDELGPPLLDDEPVLKATAMKLKIMERRARYTGTDAPTQITGDLTVNYRLVTDGQVDDGALT